MKNLRVPKIPPRQLHKTQLQIFFEWEWWWWWWGWGVGGGGGVLQCGDEVNSCILQWSRSFALIVRFFLFSPINFGGAIAHPIYSLDYRESAHAHTKLNISLLSPNPLAWQVVTDQSIDPRWFGIPGSRILSFTCMVRWGTSSCNSHFLNRLIQNISSTKQ